MNASPILKVVLKTGVVMYGPSGAVLGWLAQQVEYRAHEILPAVIVPSRARTADEAHALGGQWTSGGEIAVVEASVVS